MLQILSEKIRSVLCIGAHADDIEIGCGGTLLKLISDYNVQQIYWVVLSATPERAKEAETSAQRFLADVAEKQIVVKNFPDTLFPYHGVDIKAYFQQLKSLISPDIIFTHRREDLHQDHRTVAEITWNTFRDHLILEYEIAKYEGDLGNPNCFFQLSEEHCKVKTRTLMESFTSQKSKQWFSEDTFWALLRLRGLECNSPSRFAEAFHCRKLLF